MDAISKRGLDELLAKRPETVLEVVLWYRIARKANWAGLADVRRDFPSADQVGAIVIFNIRHNRYRLITTVEFSKNLMFVKALLTHKEYMRKEWMKWA